MRLLFLTLMSGVVLFAQTGDPLKGLRPSHPRLLLLDDELPRLRELVKSNPQARQVYEELVGHARQVQAEPPIEHTVVSRQMLPVCRTALDRIYTLALLYRLDGNREYLDRAVKEMRAIAAFDDWNSWHFLDPSELTHAFAIGYDWLYPALSEEDRELFRRAIVEKGLRASIEPYKLTRGSGWVMWANHAENWNLVCNSSMCLGALAVGDKEPELSRTIVQYALKSIPIGLKGCYDPDGGSYEGPGYWHFATSYLVYLIAGLNSALGHDFDLAQAKGFDHTGHYRVYMTGPNGRSFNYGDSSERVGRADEMFWLARKFHQPVYAWSEQEALREKSQSRSNALNLVWFQAEARRPDQAGWPLGAVFHGPEVATMRSSWTDPNAIFVGVKGGEFGKDPGYDSRNDHAHCDIGNFILDAGNVRWAMDFGGDSYSIAGYTSKDGRVYRQHTAAHNTLLIDGENQDPKSRAPIQAQHFSPAYSYVRVDMKSAYPSKVTRLERGVAIYQARHVIVQDELEAARPVEALWGMVTETEVACHGNTAELKKSGWTLSAQILSPAGAVFDVASSAGPEGQNPNTGTRKLVVQLPEKVTHLHLVVALTPHPDAEVVPQLTWKDRPLQRW